MEKLRHACIVTVLLLASPVLSGQSLLRAHGAGVPLAASAVAHPAVHPTVLQATPIGVRSVTVQMKGTPRKFTMAPAPLHALPSAILIPALPAVPTGGTGVNTDGMAHGAGAAGVTGAVGDQQYVQLAAGRIAVFRKHDGRLQAGPAGVHAIFAGAALAACAGTHPGTGAVLYDHRAGRWLIGQLVRHAGGTVQCIAVSVSADAAGSYYRYALHIHGPAQQALQAEDARMALWRDDLYLSFTLFDNVQAGYRGPRVCAIDRAALLRGRDAKMRCIDPGSQFGPVSVATVEGKARPPAGAGAPFVSLDVADSGGGRLLLWRWPVDGVRLGDPLAIPVAPFLLPCSDPAQACIGQPHPGGALRLPAERLAPRAAWRDAALMLAHPVQLPDGRVGLRWYELRDMLPAPRIYQQGTHAPDHAQRAAGSIGVDKAGNIALGYGVGGRDTPSGVRYTGRQRSDPPGRMAAEEVIVNGNGVQEGELHLWAPAGALSLDPVDDCTFWYTQQYLPLTGRNTWRSRIASFKFRNCM